MLSAKLKQLETENEVSELPLDKEKKYAIMFIETNKIRRD